jgi:hypothetical protein
MSGLLVNSIFSAKKQKQNNKQKAEPRLWGTTKTHWNWMPSPWGDGVLRVVVFLYSNPQCFQSKYIKHQEANGSCVRWSAC